jgi:hypothetical protein
MHASYESNIYFHSKMQGRIHLQKKSQKTKPSYIHLQKYILFNVNKNKNN